MIDAKVGLAVLLAVAGVGCATAPAAGTSKSSAGTAGSDGLAGMNRAPGMTGVGGAATSSTGATTATVSSPEPAKTYHQVQGKGAVGMAATELSCEPEQVAVWDKGDYVRASGCGRVAYFVKRTPKQWERAGPLLEIAEKDRGAEGESDLTEVSEGVVPPAIIFQADPTITVDQWKQVTQWAPVVQADCIVRVDGTLGYCFVLTSEASIGESINRALERYRFRPATYRGHPIPVDHVLNIRVKVQRPNCYSLSSPMARAQCERALKQIPE
jgi:hypothetical protein